MVKGLKKMVLASLACAALVTGVNMQPAYAAYHLSTEVKTATPALLRELNKGQRTFEEVRVKDATGLLHISDRLLAAA